MTPPITAQSSSSSISQAALPKSWRDDFRVHPVADAFPMMSADELRALAADIEANGIKHRCTMMYDPNTGEEVLLDGRNRLAALELLGEDSWKICGLAFNVLPHDTDPVPYIISCNIHRRHLTAFQKRDLIAKLIKAEPGKSDRQIAAQVKADHKTVAAVRQDQEARGEIPHVETRVDSKGREQPARRRVAKTDIERERDRRDIFLSQTTTLATLSMSADVVMNINLDHARAEDIKSTLADIDAVQNALRVLGRRLEQRLKEVEAMGSRS